MFRVDLNERTNAEVNGCVVGEFDRNVAPVRLIGDGDLGDGFAYHFCVLVYFVGHESSNGRGLWSRREPLDINKKLWPSRLEEGHGSNKALAYLGNLELPVAGDLATRQLRDEHRGIHGALTLS
jgi:hypothetical protein